MSWVVFVLFDGVVGIYKYIGYFYECGYMYGVVGIFYEYKKGIVVGDKIIMQCNVVYDCVYIKFVYVVEYIIICRIFLNIFCVWLECQV